MGEAPSTDALRGAAERGIAALRAMQRPSGELPTYASRRADMADARPFACSVYASTFVVHALRHWAGHAEAAHVCARAAEHLRAQRNDDGSWSYEGRATSRVPPDLDDTACAVAALLLLGERPGLAFYRLLWENEAAPGGPYYTWVGVNRGGQLLGRHLDALVNANILLCAALAGQALPGLLAYLLDVTAPARFADASDYCLSPHLLLYALARAHADGPIPELAPALRNGVAACRAVADPLQLACLVNGLLALGERDAAAPLLSALLDAQLADGSWPIAAAHSGYPPNFDGAPALTTAIALDAIGRWIAIAG
jgi:hypothetical protein